MFPLFETICINNGKLENIDLHQERFEQSYLSLYGCMPKYGIIDRINIPQDYKNDIYKLRFLYNDIKVRTELVKYHIKSIKTLKIIEDNNIDYSLKYTDRSIINKLYSQKGEYDDILIVKDNFITDTSYCNIVFYDGNSWVTPTTPLLKGTAREYLLRSGAITESKITVDDLSSFRTFKLINAMRHFDDVENTDIKNISIFK